MSERVILITGTRKGIGEALAKHFLGLGDIVIGCSRTQPRWIDAADYPRYRHFLADVADEAAVHEIFRFIRKEHGRLDALINNAGIASMNHALLTPIEAARRVFATNAIGTFLCCREAAKIMRKNQQGRIVNFSTVATPLDLEGEAVYASSKAAVVEFTHILAKEFAEYGITVNAIGPTPIPTDLIRGVSEEKLEGLLRRQAIHRFGTFEDITNVIDFYLKAESGFITGQVIYLGGIS